MLPNASWTVLEPLVETGGPHPKVRSSNTRRTIRAVLSRQENCIQWRSRCGRMARDRLRQRSQSADLSQTCLPQGSHHSAVAFSIPDQKAAPVDAEAASFSLLLRTSPQSASTADNRSQVKRSATASPLTLS
jgi:hypothetical protein